MKTSAPDNVLRFLHLTDLHVGQPREANRYGNIEEAFLRDLELQASQGWTWDVVFFTGDLAFRGSAQEYGVVTLRLRNILEHIKKLNGGQYPFFFPVPGNHDLARPSPERIQYLRSRWAEPAFRADFWRNGTNELRDAVRTAFASYQQWLELLPSPQGWRLGLLPGDFSISITIRGVSLGIVGLNAAFLHYGDDDRGKLAVDLSQLTQLTGARTRDWANEHHFNLLMTHHPPDWLDPESRRVLETEVQQGDRFSLHLFGHLHAGAHHALVGPRGYRHLFQGRSLFGAEEEGFERMHGYTQGALELKPKGPTEWLRTLRLAPREAVSRPDGGWTFGDAEHAGERSWCIEAGLGSTMLAPVQVAAPKEAPREEIPEFRTDCAPEPTRGSQALSCEKGDFSGIASLLGSHLLFLGASIPVMRSDSRAEAEKAFVRTARAAEIEAAVRALGEYARKQNIQLVFGGHHSIATALLPLAQEWRSNPLPWLLFFEHTYYRHQQSETAEALASYPGVQLIWVDGEADTHQRGPNGRHLEHLRRTMMSLPGLDAAVFVGGMSGVCYEFELFHRLRPGLPRFAVGCGGGAAESLLLDHPKEARGTLEDSGPLWASPELAVKAVMKALVEQAK